MSKRPLVEFDGITSMMHVKLFCLPYAGGGTSIYRSWQAELPAWIRVMPVELPGHGVKHALEPMYRWPPLLDHLVHELIGSVSEPFALFGHSMGALTGLELAFALREKLGVQPCWMGASGCAAPRHREDGVEWMSRSEVDLLDEVRRLDGTPKEVLAHRELLDLVLPSLRADFHLCGIYRYRSRAPLNSSITVFAGNKDDTTADPASLQAWAYEATGNFSLQMFDGGHFFINDRRSEVTAAVGKEIECSLLSSATRKSTLAAR